MSVDASPQTERCTKCGRRLTDGPGVRLWDGNDYCRECVRRASPKLLEFAERVDVLVEPILLRREDAVREQLRAFYVVGPLFALLFCYASVDNGDGLLPGLLASLVITAPAALLKCWGASRNARHVRGRVELENGVLSARYPRGGKVSFALQKCRWHRGKSREASEFFRSVGSARSIIILTCPFEPPRLWQRFTRVPCGLNDEMFEVWQALLTLGGIEQKPRWWSPTRFFGVGSRRPYAAKRT